MKPQHHCLWLVGVLIASSIAVGKSSNDRQVGIATQISTEMNSYTGLLLDLNVRHGNRSDEFDASASYDLYPTTSDSETNNLEQAPDLQVATQRDTTSADSLLLKQLEQSITAGQPPVQVLQTPAQPRSAISTNPNMSVIGDFRGTYLSTGSRNVDASFEEAEFSFQSVVDPYMRADFFLSVAKNPLTGKFEADIEEAYLTTLELPADLQLKVGKFKSTLGRVNPLHIHALPFIDLPNAYVNYFGDEGLNDEGFSLSWLVPNPWDFYQELTFEITNGPPGTPSFTRSTSNEFLYLAHIKNFFDLTENATLELGLTGLTGPNDSSYSTSLGALDLTYKWKPLRFNTYQSIVWQTEAFFSKADYGGDASVRSLGLYSFLTYQLEKRWFLTARFDYSNQPFSNSFIERAYSATAGWYATEFQKIEFEVKSTSSSVQSDFNQAMLRWIFVIGSHGAHQY